MLSGYHNKCTFGSPSEFNGRIQAQVDTVMEGLRLIIRCVYSLLVQ